MVARAADVSGARLARPPLLVTEILSPDSALRDLNLKKAAYERFGIPSYWIIDPDLEKPTLQGFELVDGTYREAAQAEGDGGGYALPCRAAVPGRDRALSPGGQAALPITPNRGGALRGRSGI